MSAERARRTTSEWARIAFLEDRDGKVAALEFCARTYAKYRECIPKDGKPGRKFHHASLPQYRRGFLESCLAFRSYLRSNQRTRTSTGSPALGIPVEALGRFCAGTKQLNGGRKNLL